MKNEPVESVPRAAIDLGFAMYYTEKLYTNRQTENGCLSQESP